MRFAGIKSLDELIKQSAIKQVFEPSGQNGQNGDLSSSNVSPTGPLLSPVESPKLPGIFKKPVRDYPMDMPDENKVRTQQEDVAQTSDGTNPNGS